MSDSEPINGYDEYDYEDRCWHYDCNNCRITCSCVRCYGQVLHDVSAPGYNPDDYHPYYDNEDPVAYHYCESCINDGKGMMAEDLETPEFERAAITLQLIWRARQYYYVDCGDTTSCDCCDSTDAYFIIQRGEGDGEIYNVCDHCYDDEEKLFKGQVVFDYESLPN